MAIEKSETAIEYTPVQKRLLKALDGSIEPSRPTVAYKMALFAVTIVNLLLPLIYFGLIFLLVYALYWNVRYNGPDRGAGWIVYFAIYPAAAITLVFMVKPLFVRTGKKEAPPLKIKPSAEPFLYEYVGAICQLVDAPTPKSIRLVCDANAYASFAGGPLGLLGGEMELTIGLPLVKGLSARQLTGVLAHEFGHFSQRGGMRLSYIVRHVNFWLMKIVFLRDRWDEKLDELSRGGDPRLWPFVWGSQFCIYLSRQLLFGILWSGSAISHYLMRQMEFDADRYEARTVGFRVFTSTFSRMLDIGIAHQMSIDDVSGFHMEGRLPDNLPALVESNIRRITPEMRKAFRKMRLKQETGLFDSHPSDRERIDFARQENAAGVFEIPGGDADPPATVLFDKCDRICRGITNDFYESVLEKSFDKKLIRPVERLIRRRDAEFEAKKCLDRYFQALIVTDRAFPLDADAVKPPENPQEAKLLLKEYRERMLAGAEEYRRLIERYENASAVQAVAIEAQSVIDCGLSFRGSDFNLPNNRHETARAQLKRARGAVGHLASRMLEYEHAAAERMSIALRLLQIPKVAAAIPQGTELQEEAKKLIPVARMISEMVSDLPAMNILFRRTAVLFSRLGSSPSQYAVQKIVDQLEELWSQLNSLNDRMNGRPYPFDHADETITLREFAIPYLPEALDIGGLVGATEMMFGRLFVLQVRLFGRLAQMAEKVEAVLGMPPLPDMPEVKSEV